MLSNVTIDNETNNDSTTDETEDEEIGKDLNRTTSVESH